MSGITGWVDFERDLTRERSTVLGMTASMALRGPDGEGVWVAPRAAIGHRRLAVFDLDDGHQPVALEHDGRTIAVAAHSGSILNHPELRTELLSRGHRFRSGGDTETLLHAYLEWGTEAPRHMEGTFAGVVWDARKEELFLVRDRLGVEPLFYHPTKSGLLFGSEAKAILAHPQVQPEVEAEGLQEILTYSGTPHVAPFRGMHRLRAGHHLVVRRSGLSTTRWWAVEAAEHTDDLDTTVATIRGLLDESITRNLRTEVPIGSLLSGGLDSSGVVGLADRELRKDGRRVRTFTVDFAQHAENFQATDTRQSPDAPFAADVVRHLHTDHTDVVLQPSALSDPVARLAVLRAKDYPTPLGDMNTSLYLLAQAVGRHTKVVLTGEAADSLFHGVAWNRDPVESTMDTFPWVARGVVRDDSAGLGCGLLSEQLLKDLSPLEYAARRYRESVAEAPHLAGMTDHEKHMRELCWVHLTNFMENQNGHTERLFKAVGLEVRMPYCDHRLVQYAYNLPWAMQNFDGREKSLLRAALRDVLPTSVIERRKTPYPVTVHPGYAAALRDEMQELLDDSQAPVLPLLNVAGARAALKDLGSMNAWARRANFELPIQLNTWLRRYGVRLAL